MEWTTVSYSRTFNSKLTFSLFLVDNANDGAKDFMNVPGSEHYPNQDYNYVGGGDPYKQERNH